MLTSSSVDREVSQKIVGIQRIGSDSAQNAPAMLAARAPKDRCPTCMIIHTVITLNKSCTAMTAIAAANVKLPKTRKKQAMMAGYPGARSAVGPVDPPKGELSPCPASKDWANVPSSIPRVKSQLCGKCAMANHKMSNRATSATVRMVKIRARGAEAAFRGKLVVCSWER